MKISTKTLFFLSVIFLTFSCQKEITNKINDFDEHLVQRSDEVTAYMSLKNYGENKLSFHYRLFNHEKTTPTSECISLQLPFAAKLNKNKFKLDLFELNSMAEKAFVDFDVDPMVYQPDLSTALQFISYETAHRAGLRAENSSQRNKILEKYLDIIVTQKGIDCDALVELLVETKPFLKKEKYDYYSQYILSTSVDELQKATLILETIRDNYESEDNSVKSYSTLSDIAMQMDIILSAKNAISILNSNI